MTKIRSGLSESWKIIKSDRLVMFLCMMPMFISMALYGALGSWLFTSILPRGRAWIDQSLAEGNWGVVAYYALITVLTILLMFIMNWTFFLVVSLLASPFNDLISARVEKRILGTDPENGGGLKDLFNRLGRTLLNEFKKLSVIFLLTVVAFFMGYSVILAPLGILLSALLFTISFLDYSWNRHDMPFSACFRQLGGQLFTYLVSGLLFLFLLSIPVINLFMMPLAAVYFTVLFTRQKTKALP